MVPEVTPTELATELSGENPPSLLDVRDAEELEISRLSNLIHIEMAELPERIGELDRDADWVVICRTGNRSWRVTQYMLQSGFMHVRNLAGGMNGWAAEVDPAMPQY